MKNFTLSRFLCFVFTILSVSVKAQDVQKIFSSRPQHRCTTMEALEEAIKKDPSLPEKWRIEGERLAKERAQNNTGSLARTEAGEIIIPIVFHIVDVATAQAGIADRDLYEQVEILNRDYGGLKLDYYSKVIPADIAARVGRVPIKFVLARRTPGGVLTSGIERRTNTTPSRTAIKTFSGGGLDAWDVTKYLNVWVGTFSGADAGLLGIATFPFTTTEGPQGVVIGTWTLPYTSNTVRSYYPTYSEGATLSHEVGHYFYLWHTFGDQTVCNNDDFRIQSGWNLPTDAGPAGDDTPAERAGPGNAYFGNPSMDYTDGCSTQPPGIMYGSFMNYFDDRALFMFSNGMRKRVIACIDSFRVGLKTSNGATPPSAIADAYLVNITPRGLPERVSYIYNNVPFKATVRNLGTAALTSVNLNVRIDAATVVTTTFPLNLAAGSDTTLTLAPLTGTAGNHTVNVYVTLPSGTDAFLHNDTIQSFINIATTATAVTPATPFTENFTSTTFPPTTFRIFNPNGGTQTWTRNATSGFAAAGAAYFNNYNINQVGTLDDLISVPLDFGTNDSALLKFEVAHAVYDAVDVSAWDGLEVYVSGDGGVNYNLAYKKTGNQLKTIEAAQAGNFTATPAQPDRWRLESINLTPYIVAGQKMIIKFRNTNAYGNNTFIDDISVTTLTKPQIDLQPTSITNFSDFGCSTSTSPSVVVRNNGTATVNTYKVNYRVDNGTVTTNTISTPIPGGGTATISLGTVTLTTGSHVLTVYTSEPNGVADPTPANDTIRKTIVIFPTVDAPLTESFEGTAFPPIGWAVSNPDGLSTWAKTTTGVRKVNANDSSSAYVRNFNYATPGTKDDLYTPIVRYSNIDSVYLKFDVAATTYNYPGATAIPEDTLEVLVTKDCGATFQTVYKKWGTQLQTVSAPNDPLGSEFLATSFVTNWRRDSVSLLPYLGTSSSFQVIFRSSHNAPGNNIYLDNVNIATRVLPSTLKQQGYLILPTAFNNGFGVWHYQTPSNLRGINVYNSAGQLVFTRQFNGNAERFINVDMSGKAAGMYFVNLRYADGNQNVTQRVIKF